MINNEKFLFKIEKLHILITSLLSALSMTLRADFKDTKKLEKILSETEKNIKEVRYILLGKNNEFVTAKQLAVINNCSLSHIYTHLCSSLLSKYIVSCKKNKLMIKKENLEKVVDLIQKRMRPS